MAIRQRQKERSDDKYATTRGQTRAGARISAVVGSWPDVEVGAHRFGGVEFRLGRRELGHLHGDSHADIAFPRKVRDELVAAGRALPHRAIPESGWISAPIDDEEGVARDRTLSDGVRPRSGRESAVGERLIERRRA